MFIFQTTYVLPPSSAKGVKPSDDCNTWINGVLNSGNDKKINGIEEFYKRVIKAVVKGDAGERIANDFKFGVLNSNEKSIYDAYYNSFSGDAIFISKVHDGFYKLVKNFFVENSNFGVNEEGIAKITAILSQRTLRISSIISAYGQKFGLDMPALFKGSLNESYDVVDFFLNKVASDPKKGEVGLEIMILKAIENMEDLSPENLAEVKSRLAKDKSRIRAMGSKGSKLERKDPGDGIDAGVNARFGMNGFDLAGYINKIIIPKINAIISIAMGKQVESKTAPESPHGASFFTEARRAQSVVNEELALKPTRDKITKARKKQLDENDDHSNVS